MITAIKAENGITVCSIPPGTYNIDGVVVYVDGYKAKEVCVKNVSNITRITETYVTSHYQNANGERLEIFDYLREKKGLMDKGYWNEDGDYYEFDDLDDEYKYRKFLKTWSEIRTTIYNESAPVQVAVVPVKFDTGNQFITSMYVLGESIDRAAVYEYNRQGAVHSIVKECFASLGMEYVEKISYSATMGKKVWGNSDHSGIRYVVAFGTYIFDDRWRVIQNRRATLEGALSQYEADKKEIEQIIKTQYALHFTMGSLEKKTAEQIIKGLGDIERIVVGLDVKQKSHSEHRVVCNKISELLKSVKQEIAESV